MSEKSEVEEALIVCYTISNKFRRNNGQDHVVDWTGSIHWCCLILSV